jgi:hypothetical protein
MSIADSDRPAFVLHLPRFRARRRGAVHPLPQPRNQRLDTLAMQQFRFRSF